MTDELLFFDAHGVAYPPAKQVNEITGLATYRAKPRGASNKTADALEFESIEGLARAMIVDGLPGRVKVPESATPNYLRFGANRLVRYRLDPDIAKGLGLSAEGYTDAHNDVLRHFDVNPQFRRERQSWSAELTEKFVALARAVHEFGLDWYFVARGKHEFRFGNKQRDRIDAIKVVGSFDRNPLGMTYGGTLPESMRVLGKAPVPVGQALIDWVARNHEFMAATARNDGGPGLWPDEYPDYANGTDLDPALIKMASTPNSYATTNLILYGPPGTGKTFATAEEAVRLCDGSVPPSRDQLMSRYRELCDERRIEFVTFHQSMAYEEFVEGLRPVTGSPDVAEDEDGVADASQSTGFRLEAQDGVFKRISERARRADQPGLIGQLDHSRSVFKIALGERGADDGLLREGLDKGLIHLGWGGDINWSDARFSDFEAIKRHWQATKDPGATGRDANIVTINAFRAWMQVGDYVILSEGRDLVRAIGRVTGEYRFDSTTEQHPHRRAVEWLWVAERAADRAPIYGKMFRRHSIYRLDSGAVNWDTMESLVFKRPVPNGVGARPHVLIIDEINRANISKVFGELITLIESDKRLGESNELKVTLPYSGDNFGVPSNLHIIATMNTADRSIALIDKALRRRFSFRELMPDYTLPEMMVTVAGAGVTLGRLLSVINDRIEYLADREHQIGHAWLMRCDTKEKLDLAMRDKIIPLIAEYFFEDWSKVADVLGGRKNNAFLDVKELAAPPGIEDEVRHRWTIRTNFEDDAYSRLVDPG